MRLFEYRHYLAPRLWEQVDRDGKGDDDCWLWTGMVDKRGFGKMKVNGEKMSVHRVAFLISNDRGIAPYRRIQHTCGNKLCCNPRHLTLAESKAARRRRWDW